MVHKKAVMWMTCLILLFCLVRQVCAHGLHHSVSEGDAMVISLFLENGAEFSNQSYEIYRPGEETPFQVGRTDALGRVAFVPDSDGEWRLRAFSEDGHGLDITVMAGGGGSATDAGAVHRDGSARIILGVAIILAAFGVVSLLWGRRKR